jgi:uncharacterized membrane protein
METKKITLSGIFAALTFVVTYVTGSIIKTPVPGGYLNVGDAVIFLAGLLYGPLVGFIAGSIGSSLSDIALGSPHFAPGTFFIKGIEGLLVGIAFYNFRNKIKLFSILVIIIGLVALTFSVFGLFNFSLDSDQRNSLIAFSIIGIAFFITGISGNIAKNNDDLIAIYSMILGGIEMVVGYYLYEFFILKYVAILEVPFNALQATITLIVAYIIYKSIRRIS